MIKLFKRIFGSDDVLRETVSGVKDGLDALIYTEEERETDAAKERAEARGILVEWMKNSQGQNIARRFLAFIIATVWLAMYLIAAALDVASVWLADPKQVNETASVIGARAYEMNGAMMLILGFYFAAPHLGKIVDGAMSRFAAREQ